MRPTLESEQIHIIISDEKDYKFYYAVINMAQTDAILYPIH